LSGKDGVLTLRRTLPLQGVELIEVKAAGLKLHVAAP